MGTLWPRARPWLAALILLAALAGETLADARDEYKAGITEIEGKNYAEAVRRFRAAIAERPEERHHLLTARRYYPHYYLGVALTEVQDCRAGIRALSESKSQGKIERSEDLLADLERRLTSCQQHIAAVDTAHEEVEDLLSQGEETGKTLEGLQTKPTLAPLWSRDERGLATRQRKAQDQLRSLRQLASTAQQAGDLTALGEAKKGAEASLRDLRAVVVEARKELGDRNAAVEEALEKLEQNAARARRTLRGARDLAPYPKMLGQKVQAVEELLAEIDRRKEESQATELGDLDERIKAARQQVLAAARRPPERLEEAVNTFLQGEYQATLDLLTEGFDDPRAIAHACILEAAAQHGLYVLDGEQDEALLGSALRASRACAEVDPPRSERFLSPRFLRFYEHALALGEDELPADREIDLPLGDPDQEPVPTSPQETERD